MVSAHIWLKPYSGKTTGQTPGQQVRYLNREGEFSPVPYVQRTSATTKDYGDYVTGGTQNLPSWAVGDAGRFFTVAKTYEGVNRYYAFQLEFSLPRELTHNQQMALRKDLMEALMPDLPALWVKHDKQLDNGERHPHIHILFSARKQETTQRNAAQTFRRWNRDNPSRGGCEKDLFWSKGYAPEQLREAFADISNIHLERAGAEERLDPRSLKRRGIHRGAIGRGGIQPSAEQHAREQAQAIESWTHRKAYKGIDGVSVIPREEFVLLVRQWTREPIPGTALPVADPSEVAAYRARKIARLTQQQEAIALEIRLRTRHLHRLTPQPGRVPEEHARGGGYRVKLYEEEKYERDQSRGF